MNTHRSMALRALVLFSFGLVLSIAVAGCVHRGYGRGGYYGGGYYGRPYGHGGYRGGYGHSFRGYGFRR